MPEQLNLPGFDAPSPPPSKSSVRLAVRGDVRPTLQLFLALFPEADDAARIAEIIDALRERHGLDGQRLYTDRLHITLLSLGDHVGAIPPVLMEAAMAAAATVVHPPIDILFDCALSFANRKAGDNAFVLCGSDTTAVNQLGQTLVTAMKQMGLPARRSSKPHMTMLYDRRVVEEHPIEPIRWTASEFVLVLSHLGKTHHEWLARWPLTPTR